MTLQKFRTISFQNFRKKSNTDRWKNVDKNMMSKESWITIEHQYTISAMELKDSFLHLIEKNNRYLLNRKKTNSCNHFCLFPISYENDKALWENKKWFMGIIRIYLAKLNNNPNAKEELLKHLSSQLKQFEFCFYNTFEVSEIVLILQSDSIKDIQSFSINLRANPFVERIFYDLAINTLFIKSLPFTSLSESLDYIAMGFIIGDDKNYLAKINEICEIMGKDPTHIVTNTYDLLLSWKKIKVSNLLSIIRKWVLLSNTISEDESFFEVHITLGMESNIIARDNSSIVENELSRHCHFLVCQLNQFHKNARTKKDNPMLVDPIWLEPLKNLVSLFVHINTAPELNKTLYLLYPSVHAIITNLKKNNQSITQQIIIESVSDLIYATDRAIQTQKRHALIQEYYSSTLYFPINSIEYFLAFLKRYIQLIGSMEMNNNYNNQNVEFFLVPQPCERIEASEVFSYLTTKYGLVKINIPFNCFFNIKKTLIALCHEISHYSGEKCRCREIRKVCFLSAASSLMAKTIFLSYHPVLIKVINNRLNDYVKHFLYTEKKDIEQIRLQEIQNCILSWANNIFDLSQAGNYSSFIQSIIIDGDYMSKNDNLPLLSLNTMRQQFELIFHGLLNDLRILFRETFADLCVIHLLNLPTEEYLENFTNELQYSTTAQADIFAIRIATCLSVCKKEITTTMCKDLPVDFFQRVKLFMEQCNECYETENLSQTIPNSSILELKYYLEECYAQLKESNNDRLMKIQILFNNLAKSNINDYHQVITDYRKTIWEDHNYQIYQT